VVLLAVLYGVDWDDRQKGVSELPPQVNLGVLEIELLTDRQTGKKRSV